MARFKVCDGQPIAEALGLDASVTRKITLVFEPGHPTMAHVEQLVPGDVVGEVQDIVRAFEMFEVTEEP